MKEKLSQILVLIDSEIDEIDLYGYDIIPTSLSMVHRLQGILNDLRNQLQTYVSLLRKMKYHSLSPKSRKYLVDYCIFIKYIV